MTEINVEIKTEPLDEEPEVFLFKEEELIIKTEIDVEDTSWNPTPLLNSPKKDMDLQDTKIMPPKLPLSPSAFECNECRRLFVSESALDSHNCFRKKMRKHLQAGGYERKLLKHTRFSCNSCDQQFKSRREMSYHKCKTEDDKRLRGRTINKCTICGQTFHTLLIYEEHMRIHRNKLKRSPIKARKPMCIVPKSLLDPKVMVFACNLCDISFSTANGLQSHNMMHGQYEHICKQCGKSFKCAADLKTHTIGDTCTKESVADFLGSCDSEGSADIKKEVDSEDDTPMDPVEEVCTSYSRDDTAKFIDACVKDTVLEPVRIIPKKNVAVLDKHHKLMVNFEAQKNAFTLSSKLGPSHGPQRLDVIIDGLGNAFVMKREDLVTGALQYPQIQTFQNQQVVVDAQGKVFKFSQKPPVNETQLPLVRISQQQNAFFIAQDHCYTKSYPLVKEEPAELEVVPPSDPMSYEDLIVDESVEVKIKEEPDIEMEPPSDPINFEDLFVESMGRKRKTAMDQYIEVESVPFLDTDFDQVIASDCVELSRGNYITATVKEEPSDDLTAEETSNDCTIEMDPHSVEDFEEMIDSTTPPQLLVKCEIMENLHDEYQKAKKKKLGEASADESSQQSTQEGPLSIFATLTETRRFYNATLRKLDKRYRYVWICSKCPKQYIQRHSFFKHQMNAHYKDVAEFKSELFELRPELLVENITVEGYCHLCRVTLADAVTLQKHKKEIHAEDENASKLQFRCYICGKFCSSRSTLSDHVHSNCGKNPQYGCEVCGKKFYSRSTLQLHKSMHTGVLPFKCTYCDKRVRTRGQLTVHTRTHTGERPFPCKVCERRFTHRETLISHLSRHIDMKRYKCNGCEALFASISGLKTHRDNRMQTCGKFKFNSRPIGPRVRVIKGNVIFEPQPKFNPYSREYNDSTQENAEAKGPDDKENDNLLKNIHPVAKTKANSEVQES